MDESNVAYHGSEVVEKKEGGRGLESQKRGKCNMDEDCMYVEGLTMAHSPSFDSCLI